jgi:uncharacterized protein YcbK (DUF882 family)
VNGFNSAAMTAPALADGTNRLASSGKATAATEAQGDAELPARAAAVPATSPQQPKPAQQTAEAAATPAEAAAAEKPAEPGTVQSAGAEGERPDASVRPGTNDKTAGEAKAQVVASAAEWPQTATPPPKKKGLLSFFGSTPASAAPSSVVRQDRDSAATPARDQAKTFIENRPARAAAEAGETKREAEKTAKPIIDLEAAPNRKPVQLASLGGENGNGLPGVRTTALFEIKRKSGIDDDSDIDLHEEEGPGVILASAAGMARLAPNGLLKQTESVDVACLKPSLVRVLKTIERRFGRKLIVTSGYRSRSYNMRVRGAKNSQHMYCAAADIQVPGVSKWELAKFARSMQGRGGVGTYCHTNSVHVDIGPERDWNWRCRRGS